ncbi:MAG TPA: hypothetical protein VJ834_17290 [Burkholderiales bacterium]|nr:hypothetical protein [Burkholderiales bacterium]
MKGTPAFTDCGLEGTRVLLWIKIAVFYGAPILAVGLAAVYFAVLLVRVRRGVITRKKAGMLYALTLLLPIAVVFVIWGTAELASYLTVGSQGYVWDGRLALDVLLGLSPIALYVGAPIAVLAVAFWLTLALRK